MFKILHSSSGSAARTGELQTNHGVLSTPFFMPIATRGAVKLLGSEDLEELGASVLLSNTYHLMLRPGTEVIKALGGLHSFMRWNHPILTDSGGYQVFSLTAWRRLTEEGVWFRSPNGGAEHFLSPERSMEIQHLLGSDMVMVFDECTEYPVSGERAQESMELTTRWAKRSKEAYQGMGGRGLLFGIAQGSSFPELRKRSAEELREIGFDGYAIGGLSIGEDRQETYQLVNLLAGIFPVDRPRYFMGAGKPEEIVEYVRRGMDMFDCVLPTRDGRHGLAYRFTDEARLMISNSREWWNKRFYEGMHITNESFRDDTAPIDSGCACLACRRYHRAYLRHLFVIGEPLGARLATIHNLRFYMELMGAVRAAIGADKL